MTSEEEERRPPAKKRKLNQNSRNGEFLDNSETFYPFRLVPSPQEARTLETVDVWVTSTLATAGVSELFIQQRLTPIEIQQGIDLTHLKRVRKRGKLEDGFDIIDIILCSRSALSENGLESVLTEAQEKGLSVVPRVEQVSRWPAYTTRQLSEFGALWPATLRKDMKRMIKDPEKEASLMRQFMMQTISLLKHMPDTNDLPIAALVVNSKTSQVLLTAYDTRISTCHPLNHAVMALLNNLPSLQPAHTFAAHESDEEEQYYAQMYDVYVTHEPCTMCCMALVHSRIRRLVFWRGMTTGARQLGWMERDEPDGNLNHRYMCFAGIEGALEDEFEMPQLEDGIYV